MSTEQEIIRHYRAGVTEAALAALDVIQKREKDYTRQCWWACDLWAAVGPLGCDNKAFWDMRSAYREARDGK